MAALVRRASSVLIPLAATHSPVSSLFVHHLCNPLSTSTPFLEFSDKATPVSNHNLSEKIDAGIASYSNEVLPVPGGFPFYVDAYIGRSPIILTRSDLRGEDIRVRLLPDDDLQGNGDDTSIFTEVSIVKKDMHMASEMTVKPNRLLIHQVILRSYGSNMEDYREYLKTKGITSKTISLLYRCLGYMRLPVSEGITEEQKRVLRNPGQSEGQQTVFRISDKLALLDGLPFDSIKQNRFGFIILQRKTEDEIIEIKVSPMFHDHDPYGDQYFYFDHGYDRADDEDDGDGGGDGEIIIREKDTDALPLSLYFKIFYGSNFNRCSEILCRAYPDDHDQIAIDQVSIRNANKSGVNLGEKHLVEFEDFYKERGIEPCNLNFFFSYLEKRKEMKRCDSIGTKKSSCHGKHTSN